MNSLIGLSIGALICVMIGILRSSKEYHALKNRHGHKSDSGYGEDSQFYEDFVLRYEDFKILEKNPRHPLQTKAEAGNLLEAQGLEMEGDDPSAHRLDLPAKTPAAANIVKVYASRDVEKMKFLGFSIPIGIGFWIFYIFYVNYAVLGFGFLIGFGLGCLALFGPSILVLMYYKRLAKTAHIPGELILEFNEEEMRCHSYKCGSERTIQWTDILSFTPKLPSFSLGVSIDIKHKVPESDEIRVSNYLVNAVDIELVEFIELLEHHTGLQAEPIGNH